MNFPFGQYLCQGGQSDSEIELMELQEFSGKNIDRIGIQSKPGMPFKINNEQFYMNRTGIFEISLPITSLKFNQYYWFCIDYHYINT